MTDPFNMPVIALTREGVQKTTIADALDALELEQFEKAKARHCDECGKYQKFNDLKHVAADDGGSKKLCPECLDEKSDDGSGKTWKQLCKAQWGEALEAIDEALDASLAWVWYQQLDSVTKARAFDRLAKANRIGQISKATVRREREQASTARLTYLAKAELARQQTKRLKKQTKKLRKQAAAAQLRKARAIQALDALMAEQLAIGEQISQIGKRVDVVYANAQRAFGVVARQRELQAVAELAKRDQEQARWMHKAELTSDTVLRAAYLARANRAVWDLDD